jgi:hypothetical protein
MLRFQLSVKKQAFARQAKWDSAVTGAKTVDVVYTWVDDRWPGYRDQLARYSDKPDDLDPGRTRDNLDLMRYSLRGLEKAFPMLGTVYLLSCRPQVPAWLDTSNPRLRIIHHDEIMSDSILPTFNSLAIITHLHLLPGLSDKFLYLEDDMLIRPALKLSDLETGAGLTRIYPWKYWTPQLSRVVDPERETAWNLALAMSDHLVNQRFGTSGRRRQICHSPLLIERAAWQSVMEDYAESIAHTRASRFRSAGNVDPASLYLWTLLSEGRAVLEDRSEGSRISRYVPLEDFWPVTFLALLRARSRLAAWVNMNDNFGPSPSHVTERLVRRVLQAWYPDPSSFERRESIAAA